jgi:hypothetical protein
MEMGRKGRERERERRKGAEISDSFQYAQDFIIHKLEAFFAQIMLMVEVGPIDDIQTD